MAVKKKRGSLSKWWKPAYVLASFDSDVDKLGTATIKVDATEKIELGFPFPISLHLLCIRDNFPSTAIHQLAKTIHRFPLATLTQLRLLVRLHRNCIL
jgi:hypothetical protein